MALQGIRTAYVSAFWADTLHAWPQRLSKTVEGKHTLTEMVQSVAKPTIDNMIIVGSKDYKWLWQAKVYDQGK